MNSITTITETGAVAPSGYITRLQLGVIKATALLVGLGIGLSAQAAPDERSSRSEPGVEKSAPRHFHGQGRGMDQECGPQDRLEKLHKQLNLDAKQEALWAKAKASTDKLRDDMMKEREQRRDSMKKQPEGKAPDLRALAADQDKLQEARQQKFKAVREEWLKLYDTLSGDQKQQASEFLIGQIGMLPPHRGGDDRPHQGPNGAAGPGSNGPSGPNGANSGNGPAR